MSARLNDLRATLRFLTGIFNTDLATKDEAACWELFAKLEHQGFIRKSSRNGTFDVVKNQKKVADAQFKYLDPFVRISDYVRYISYHTNLKPQHTDLRYHLLIVISTLRSRIKRLHKIGPMPFRKLSSNMLMAEHLI